MADETSVITIRTPGLTLPDPGASRETYTRAERVSVATLALVAAKALRLVSSNRNRHKIVLLDEAWFLLASTQGRLLLNRLMRLARSMNATILLATQRLADLGDLSELVGVFFIFGQDSVLEAERALRLLGLDPEDPGLRSRLTEYRQGLCLMRDLDGRVGEVQFDLADPELLAALDTTPKAAERSPDGERPRGGARSRGDHSGPAAGPLSDHGDARSRGDHDRAPADSRPRPRGVHSHGQADVARPGWPNPEGEASR
ncbi:MAG TPA: ATP-binding protein [Solirubrobacterales bacterium]|nr:ATP-binding protein [Solirubrobacterales bacterium]